MRCIICSKNDWENVDQFRLLEKHDGVAVGMSICKSCGFVSYPEKYKTEDEIKEYYRKDYRGGPPTYANITTGKRKIGYHESFLKEVILKWRDEKLKPVIGECGSALGMVLHWFKQVVPECEVHGTELTTNYRNVASNEYGIDLKEDFDLTKKYDLIMSYKVAEHQIDVDLRIKEYADALNEGGYLYISVPTWFNALSNSGIGGFDLEYYYHPDHINVWTRVLFEEILRKSGLAIIKVDRVMYGDSYLCKRDDSVLEKKPEYEDYKEIKAAMGRIKKAHELMLTQKAGPALEVWGNFPLAWHCYYEKTRAELDKKYKSNGLQIAEVFCSEMEKACGAILEVEQLRADILVRYGHYPEAIAALESIVEVRTNDSRALLTLSQCFRQLSNIEQDEIKKTRLLLTSRDICRKVIVQDEQARPEAFNWALHDQALLNPSLVAKVITEQKTITT